jgi:hypothetical protein
MFPIPDKLGMQRHDSVLAGLDRACRRPPLPEQFPLHRAAQATPAGPDAGIVLSSRTPDADLTQETL